VVTRTAFAVLLVAALAGPAGADGNANLDQAQQAIDNIDYEAARSFVGKALDGGGLALADHLRALRIAGEVEAALGNDAGAREHFATWIYLDPKAKLADGLSPKITAPFDEARAATGALVIDVSLERSGDGVKVTLVTSDPLALVHGFEASGGGAQASGTGLEATLDTTDPSGFEVTVVVIDERNNQIAVRTVVAEPAASAEPPAATGGGGGGKSGWPAAIRWPTWTALAVVAAGTGGYFSYRVGQAEDDLEELNANPGAHTADEARAIQDRGERDALVANVLYGVAGAAAIAAVLTFVLEPDDDPDVEVLPSASSDGASVTATIRF
jgi:hypothetical protein